MKVYDGKTVLVYVLPENAGKQQSVWKFHWFDGKGNELGITELKPEDLPVSSTDAGQEKITIEGFQLVPMKDGLWGVASVFKGEKQAGSKGNDILVKVPEL